MNESGNGRAPAVVDVGHGAGNGSRARNTAKERRAKVGNALSDEFLVGVMVVATDTVGHSCGEQRLNGAEHGDDHRRWKEFAEAVPRDVGHGERRQRGLDFAEAVVDGGDRTEAVFLQNGVEEIGAHCHHDDGHERTRDFLRHFRRQGDDCHAENANGRCYPVSGVEMLEIDHPLRNKVARHLTFNLESEKFLNLRGEDGDGDTAREAHHNGVWNELDDGAEPKRSQQNEENARHHGGHDQSRHFQGGIADNAVDDDDEGTRWATDLHA